MASDSMPAVRHSRRRPSTTPWKPWSTHVDVEIARQEVCGLLNKIAKSNFDSVSEELGSLSVSAQRKGAYGVLDMIAASFVERAICDPRYAALYAELCQSVQDDLSSEYDDWTRVNLDGREDNEYTSLFLVDLQSYCRTEFNRLVNEPSLQLCSLMVFAGELLLNGVLGHNDLHGIMGLLLLNVEQNNEHSAIALCRFLRRVAKGPDGLRHLEQLGIVADIDTVLEEDTIIPQIRYLLMGILDLLAQPGLVDVFDSMHNRAEIYGFDSDEDAESVHGLAREARAKKEMELDRICQLCEECTRRLFATRSLQPVVEQFKELSAEYHHILVDCLVHAALSSNDLADAQLVSSLFSLKPIQGLLHRSSTFQRGFIKEMEMLEDTTLDVPDAYHLMAIMLHACDIGLEDIEDLAAEIIHPDDLGRIHLLGEYYSLDGETVVSARISRGEEPNRSAEGSVEGEDESQESDAIAIAY